MMKTYQPTFFFFTLFILVSLLSRDPQTDNTIVNCHESDSEKRQDTPFDKPFDLNDKYTESIETLDTLFGEQMLLSQALKIILL